MKTKWEPTIYQDREPASHYCLSLLDAYAESILAYTQDYRALYGAAIDMRKSMELMGAYLLRHVDRNGERMTPVVEGDKVLDRLHSTRDGSVRVFMNQFEALCKGENRLESLLHYQGHREVLEHPAPDWQARLMDWEEDALWRDHDRFRSLVVQYVCALRCFMENADDLAAIHARSREDYPNLCVLLDMSGGENASIAYKDRLDTIREHVYAYYHEDENALPDPWLSWHCTTLKAFEGRQRSLGRADTMSILLRIMCERVLFCYLYRHGCKFKKTNLDAYISQVQDLRAAQKEAGFGEEKRTIAGLASLIQTASNRQAHWFDGDLGSMEAAEPRKRRRYERDLQTSFVAGSDLFNRFVEERRPQYVWDWVDYYERDTKKPEYQEALSAAKRENRRLRMKNRGLKAAVAVCVCIAVLAVLMIIKGFQVEYRVTALEIKREGTANETRGERELTQRGVNLVRSGETLVFDPASSLNVDVERCRYYYNDWTPPKKLSGSYVQMTVPNGEPGSRWTLHVSALGVDRERNRVELPWEDYILEFAEYPGAQAVYYAMDVFYQDQMLANRSTTCVLHGTSLPIRPGDGKDVQEIFFAWDNEAWMTVPGATSYDIPVPETFKLGEEHYLYVRSKNSSGELSDTQAYKLIVVETLDTQVSMQVTYDGRELADGDQIEVSPDDEILIRAAAKEGIHCIGTYYYLNGEKLGKNDQYSSTAVFVCPQFKSGTKIYLYVEAVAKNDSGEPNTVTKSGWRECVLIYK